MFIEINTSNMKELVQTCAKYQETYPRVGRKSFEKFCENNSYYFKFVRVSNVELIASKSHKSIIKEKGKNLSNHQVPICHKPWVLQAGLVKIRPILH